MNIGPNVKKLIITKMSRSMVPSGSTIGSVLNSMVEPGRLLREWQDAKEWVTRALDLVKNAPDNTFDDDEAIAGEILRRLDERKPRNTPHA